MEFLERGLHEVEGDSDVTIHFGDFFGDHIQSLLVHQVEENLLDLVEALGELGELQVQLLLHYVDQLLVRVGLEQNLLVALRYGRMLLLKRQVNRICDPNQRGVCVLFENGVDEVEEGFFVGLEGVNFINNNNLVEGVISFEGLGDAVGQVLVVNF